MARPALVIGLGGAGQWVLTFLKKDLLEIGDGEIPPGVKLLAFDTTKHASAMAGYENQFDKKSDNQNHDPRRKLAGAVTLDHQTEFIHIGAPLSNFVKDIRAGKHEHLNWINATDILRKLPDAALNADDGAGAIRQIGRLCLVKDLQSRTTSRIISTIANAMEAIRKDREVTVDNRLEIIIVGSMSGGTGAGLLVDVPMLCRNIAPQGFGGNIVIRGFIVSPRAFVSGVLGKGQTMLARSFAAWRELDRFLITSSEYGANQIKYSQNFKLESQARLYDSTYIIDPYREHNSLETGKPEEGLYPSIANAISAILDNSAGRTYSEQVINLSDSYKTLPFMPTHSAIGSYTMKVPVYYAQQEFTHQLALKVLDELLAPEKNAQKRITALKETKNAEVDSSKIGMNAASDFLTADGIQYGEKEIQNTNLLKLIGRFKTQDVLNDAKVINSLAKGGLSRSNSEFALAMLDIKQDARGNQIVGDFNRDLTFKIWQTIKPSTEFGDTPGEAFKRLTNDQNGAPRVILQKSGEFENGLEEAKYAQLRLFANLLQVWTDKTLNGISVSQVASKAGKLGYIKSVYQNLVDIFKYFDTVLDQISQTRNSQEFQTDSRVEKGYNASLNYYKQVGNKSCPFTFWDKNVHPEAHQAQRRFLQAAQRKLDNQKDKILLAVVKATANEMKTITEDTLSEINRWITHLATGEKKTLKNEKGETVEVEVKSVYQMLEKQLNDVKVNHILDENLQKISEIIGSHQYQQNDKLVEERFGKLSWKVKKNEAAISLADKTEITIPKSIHINLAISDPRETVLSNLGENASGANAKEFALLCEQPFTQLVEDHPFAKEIQKVYSSGDQLALQVHEKGEPLVRLTDTAEGPKHDPAKSAVIRVKSNIDDSTHKYLREFEEKLSDLDPRVKNTLVDSDDRYKMTLVRVDDIIKSEDFDIWETCRDAYVKVAKDHTTDTSASDLHVFQAEINACQYERKIAEVMPDTVGYRILHPDVVALLEDNQRLEMFFRALALGMIQRKTTPDGLTTWTYSTPDKKNIKLFEEKQQFGSNTIEVEKQTYFKLINQFVVKGEDIKNDSLWIDFDKLDKYIKDSHTQLGTAKVKNLYKRQITAKDSMISNIRDYIDKQRSKEKEKDHREKIARDHEDLANLAETIYWIASEQGF